MDKQETKQFISYMKLIGREAEKALRDIQEVEGRIEVVLAHLEDFEADMESGDN